MQIGFIGLGIMGRSMAYNLLQAGYTVHLYNRSRHKADALAPNGGIVHDLPASAAANADVLVTMLGDPAAVKELAYGPEGFLRNLPAKACWVDATTVDPTFASTMAEEAAQRNIRYMDAPVLGSREPAEKAELVFLAGGSAEDVAEVQPLLDVMGKKVKHMGPASKGAAMKMVFNHQLGHAMAAFAEGVQLGTAMGLDEQQVMHMLLGGPVTAPFLQGKQEKIEQGDYSPDFPLKWMQKDLHLASKAAYEANASGLMTSTVKELYQFARQQGWADQDFSAIYAYLRSLHQSREA